MPSSALQQYEACARLLEAELGIAPDAETAALAEQICRGDLPLQPVSPAAVDAGQPFPAVRHNLPPQATPFVGRARELAQVAARLADPACRLLTVSGLGSGVVINDGADILSSLHVVTNSMAITVTFADGTESMAQIIAAEPATDIAVLRPVRPPLSSRPPCWATPTPCASATKPTRSAIRWACTAP